MTRDDRRIAREVQDALDGRAREVRVCDGWIEADLVPTWPLPPDAWATLERNAALSLGVKLCIVADGTPCLRAEAAPPTTPRTLGALREAAAAAVHGDDAPAGAWSAPEEHVAETLESSGWPWAERGAGAWAVRLDVPGYYREAECRTKSGRSTVPVRLVLDAAPSHEAGRRAVATALLRATGECRLVRGVVDAGRPALEVPLAPAPEPDDLAHACAALSVAARVVARAAELLAGDAELAGAYLAVVGGEAPFSGHHPTAHRRAGAQTIEETGNE